MPENQAVFPPSPFFSFDDDDDGFGEFKFVSSSSSPPPNPLQHHEDDDWGDFVVVGSQSFPNNSLHDPISATPNKWEKPRGALPLSIFGDEEVEEPEPLHPHTLFGNGFSSSSYLSSPTPARAKEMKDLIADLYSQAAGAASNGGVASDLAKGEDDFHDDENSWEFKDAFSPDAVGVKEEEKSRVISGLEKTAAAGDSGIQVVGNRLETVQEASAQLGFSNGGRELSDAYAAHNRFTNGLDFDSDVAHNHCIPDTPQQTNYIKNGNELHPSMENGDKSVDIKLWGFKDAFSENAVETGSLGKQKTPDAGLEVLMPTDKIQGTGNLWEDNLGYLRASTYTNGKEDLIGSFRKYNGSLCEPNYGEIGIKDLKFHSVIALDDIISNLYDETDQSHAVYPTQCPTVNGPNLAELSPNSVFANGDSYFDDTEWEFQKALDTTVSDQNSGCEIDKSLSNDSTQNTYFDLYCRLKEESLFLMVHHLGDLKKAHEVAALSGEQAKVSKISEEIQAVYRKLHEAMISENVYMGNHPLKDMCVNQLVEVIKEPHFRALEQEYRLSEKILSAEKDLSAAIELFGHATSVLRILGLASREEQQTYIIAWSKMALACAQELQHGAMIWTESLGANISKQILSQGNRYFMALGEIYRVSEILRASLKLYKPWMLTNQEDCSREVVTCLEKCAEAWTTSGLEKTLESVSAAAMDLEAKVLLESIKLIHDLDELSFRNHAFGYDNIICRLSLLPMGNLQDMKVVTWNGDHYCLKLANLWVNRVSYHPPQLPHIHVS